MYWMNTLEKYLQLNLSLQENFVQLDLLIELLKYGMWALENVLKHSEVMWMKFLIYASIVQEPDWLLPQLTVLPDFIMFIQELVLEFWQVMKEKFQKFNSIHKEQKL